MSNVKEHAEALETAIGNAAGFAGFATAAEYLQDRGFNDRGPRFFAVEVLHELRAAGWELMFRNAEDAH
ncbi:hypothetical protein [Hymenobacter lapidiphilus]|uniref:Uncharacterized protein n=1 Tax=Hymenobacter lapidiphilus TaxID=2608003 RepID=A0A7Y7PL03_9BACT|nr:hypothetical protein [Hymenobacter lapidiphilus]NVO29680.1 hypothetical protein [Hymenobacter lapidiphilus]